MRTEKLSARVTKISASWNRQSLIEYKPKESRVILEGQCVTIDENDDIIVSYGFILKQSMFCSISGGEKNKEWSYRYKKGKEKKLRDSNILMNLTLS